MIADSLDHLFGALSDRTRRRIVEVLLERQPLTTRELVALFPATRWAVMKHLAVLREAHLLQTFPQGRRRLHFVDRRALELARDWLASSRMSRDSPPAAPDRMRIG